MFTPELETICRRSSISILFCLARICSHQIGQNESQGTLLMETSLTHRHRHRHRHGMLMRTPPIHFKILGAKSPFGELELQFKCRRLASVGWAGESAWQTGVDDLFRVQFTTIRINFDLPKGQLAKHVKTQNPIGNIAILIGSGSWGHHSSPRRAKKTVSPNHPHSHLNIIRFNHFMAAIIECCASYHRYVAATHRKQVASKMKFIECVKYSYVVLEYRI